MSTNAMKRLNDIDCAKGIGILLVVIAHHLQESEAVIVWICSFHMPLFFMITGYLHEHRKKQVSLKSAIAAGGKALLYPYSVFSILLILWWIVLGAVLGSQPEEPLRIGVLKTITTYGRSALWFLPALFWVTIIDKTAIGSKRWLLLVVSVVGGCFVSRIVESTEWRVAYQRYIMMYFGCVLLALSFVEIGHYAYRFICRLDYKLRAAILIISLMISVELYNRNILVSMAFSRIGNPVIYYLTACAGSMFVLLLSKAIADTWIGQRLVFWGQNSLCVMALHMDVSIEIAWIILSITGITEILSFRSASVLAIMIELIALYVMIRVINRYAIFLLNFPDVPKTHRTEEKSK